MFSVHSGGTAVHRTLPKGRVYGVYALACTQVYEVDGKVYGECTDCERGESSPISFLKTSSENCHFGHKFLGVLRHRGCSFQIRNDHRVTYSMVARKRLIGKAVNVSATTLLPSRHPVLVPLAAVL